MLTSIQYLPPTLTVLICSDNRLSTLPYLPSTLTILDCSTNQIDTLPSLPSGLQVFNCSGNFLSSLPSMGPSVVELICHFNYLKSLPTIPSNLTSLNCSNNRLTSTVPIIKCRKIQELIYHGNNFATVPTFIRRMFSNRTLITNNTQNVHDSSIQDSIRKSIISLISSNEQRDIIEVLGEVSESSLSKETKKIIKNSCSIGDVYTVLDVTFAEVFSYVWQRIVQHKEREELLKILDEEMKTSIDMCFTRKISDLINTLNGFYDDIEVRVSSSEEIARVVIQMMKKYSGVDLLTKLRAELEHLGIEESVIEEWIDNID